MPRRKIEGAPVAKRMLEELAKGRTVIEICENEPWAPGVTLFFNWIREDRYELKTRYAEARRIGADVLADRRVTKMHHYENACGVRDGRVDAALVRLTYETEKELRTRYFPEAWAGRQVVTTTDKSGDVKELNVIAVPVKDLAGLGATPPREEKPKEENEE